nr:hypothetical protein [Tanacetum cinerariifolium]
MSRSPFLKEHVINDSMIEGIDMGKAVNDDLVVTESSGTKSKVQDDNSRSGNDTDADDADIRPIYDEEPMAKVQLVLYYNRLERESRLGT